MKILFIYSDLFPSHLKWTGYYYVGVGSLSAVLREAGHETSLIHITNEFSDKGDLLDRVKAFDPQLIAFSSTTLTFKYVQEIAGWLYDANLKIPVISGGIHSTLLPLDVIGTQGIDMACVGEGEIALKNLVETLDEGKDFRQLPGIWVNDKGTVYKNGVSPIVHDLDQIPYSDRSIFDYPNLEHEKEGRAVFMASRGCPYNCTYCSNRLLRQTVSPEKPGDFVRFNSVDRIIAEIKHVLKNYSFVNALHFDDDVFFLKKQWAIEFTEKYKTHVGLPFTCNMRPNHLKADIADLLKEAGCLEVKMGLESGNEYIRNKVLKRNLSDKQMYNSFKVCHDAGIKIHTYNIVGVPYETSKTVLDTIKMNAKAKSHLTQVSVFFPFPKTELYDICREKGFTTDNEGYDFFIPMLNINTISRRKIYYFYKNFKIFLALYSKTYDLPSPICKVLVSIYDRLLQSYFLNVIGFGFTLLRKTKSFYKSIGRV